MVYIRLFLLTILLVSCNPYKDLVKKDELIQFKENKRLHDSKYLESYLNEYGDDESILVIMSEDITNDSKDIFITQYFNLYKIYLYPISGYIKTNDRIVLVYSKKDKYINPRYYPESFVNKLKETLLDNWTMYKREDEIEFTPPASNHSPVWKIDKNGVLDKKISKFNRRDFLYNNKDFDYLSYDNMNDIRIKKYSN